MLEFTLKPSKDESEPFIELNKLLKVVHVCASGAEANQVISEGMVQVNGAVDTRKRAKIKSGDQVAFEGHQIQVK